MSDPDILQLPARDPEGGSRRLVMAGGRSRTIAGVIKMAVGVLLRLIISLTGWAFPEARQLEIVEGVTTLVVLGLEVWGMAQVYQARQSRGDVSLTGQRVAAVETVVLPPTIPPTQ